MNVVIFGCGRTGASLGLMLVKDHRVTIIEQNSEALRRLGIKHNCKIVMGSGIDEDVLEKAGINEADVFFAVTRGDNSNIMAAQIARLKYKVPKVCIKVADPHRAEAYRKMGYECVVSSALIAGFMRDWMTDVPFGPISDYNTLPKEMEL